MTWRAWLLVGVGLVLACAPTLLHAPASDYHLVVAVQDAEARPIPIAWVWRDDTGYKIHVNAQGTGVAWRPLVTGFLVCAQASGYVSRCALVDQARDQTVTIALPRAEE